eukprot:scpid65450/ scgid34438/ 24-hydroxycholesterol 7-alpha-hydroxylase; Cytochrome P450 39A1; Oxysterol 7-alpha-hydroxylase
MAMMILIATLTAVALVAIYCYVYIFRRSQADVPGVPRISGLLPWVGCGLRFVGNPRKFLEDVRKQHGDNFILEMFGTDMFFTFSAKGLEALYKIREADASFTEATRAFLGLKLPGELVQGSMSMFHKRLKKSLLHGYIHEMNSAIEEKLVSLDSKGEFELFAFMRQIVHQVGFRVWLGPETAQSDHLRRFIAAFDALDVEKGFQSLSSLFVTTLSGKYYEKKALKQLQDVLRCVWESQQEIGTSTEEENANFATLHEMYGHLSTEARFHQVAIDVFQFHLASQANMYASLSWMLANVLLHNSCREKVMAEIAAVEKKYGPAYTSSLEALDEMVYIEQVVHESLRISQQSLTLRKVMKPCSFLEHSLPKGLYIATLLSITNNEVGSDEPGTDVFQPGRRSVHQRETDAQYHISTFGHGFHSCPGLKFAMTLSKIVLCLMLAGDHCLKMEPQFSSSIEVPPGSVGAVARSTKPCIVRYTK